MSIHSNPSVSKAISWICNAQDACSSDGVPAVYMPIKGWSDPYPETTGYIIPTFLELSNILKNEDLKKRALRMGEWLLSIQNQDGSFPGGTWSKDKNNPPSVFNSGQILFGLCSLWQHEQEEKWKTAGIKCAQWLASVQNADGSWTKFAYRNTLHTYKTRVSWPMLIADQHWELSNVRDAAERNLDHALSRHKASGWIENASFDDDTPPVLHTFSYTVQGMLEAGVILEKQQYIDAAVRSASALIYAQLPDGSLPGDINEQFSDNWYRCLTGISQTAIIWARLAELGDKSKDWSEACHKAIQYLEKNQSNLPFKGFNGGFSGSKPIYGPYMRLRYPNWAVKFYLDAVISHELGMGKLAWG